MLHFLTRHGLILNRSTTQENLFIAKKQQCLQYSNPTAITYRYSHAITKKEWTIRSRIKACELPSCGKIRYVPPENYNPNSPLPRGPQKGYIDRFGNEWVKGPPKEKGELFEWDVQLSRHASPELLHFSRNKKHVNISRFGKITH